MAKTALIGATGLVGGKILSLLEKSSLPIDKLDLYASSSSAGKKLLFRGEELLVKELKEAKPYDLCFFAAGKAVAKAFIPLFRKTCPVIIDSSSLYRMQEDVPLVIPEINPHHLKNHKGLIASPNCTTSILLMPLFPLHRAFSIKRIVASTYQAASGGGYKLLQKLFNDTKKALLNEEASYGFNLYLHDSPLLENSYNEEEIKMLKETQKILDDPSIEVTATCVRVPIPYAHSISANVEFKKPIDLDEAKDLIRKAKGVTLFEDRFPTPQDATGKNEVLCGRVRYDRTRPNTLEFWIVGDQLLKGAALNAVQIAETLFFKPRFSF